MTLGDGPGAGRFGRLGREERRGRAGAGGSQPSSCRNSCASCAGLVLPPLQMIATLRPANRCGSASIAARAAAPAGSTRLCVFSIMTRVAVLTAIDAALGNAPVEASTLALLAQEGVLHR
jgi:hypothetical protein